MQLRIVLAQEEDGRWSVWCPELPGCASFGESRESAIENIREAIDLYLEPAQIVAPEGAETLKIAV